MLILKKGGQEGLGVTCPAARVHTSGETAKATESGVSTGESAKAAATAKATTTTKATVTTAKATPAYVTFIEAFQQPIGMLAGEVPIFHSLLDGISPSLLLRRINGVLHLLQVYALFLSQVGQGLTAPQLSGQLVGRHA